MKQAGTGRRGRRIALSVLRAAAILYVGVVIVFYWIQAWLIFPGSVSQGRPNSVVHATPGVELISVVTAGGDTVQAMFGHALGSNGQPRTDSAARPTIIYFYGNGMCMANTAMEFQNFRRLGANVLVADYVGYGMSSGRPSEQGCYQTADAIYDWLTRRTDVDPAKIILGGWSLGSGVAVDLASRKPVAGLMLFSAFTSMSDAGQRLFPVLPVRWLLRHRFNSLAKISRINCPVILAHGTVDDLVPFDMSETLAKAVKGPVTRIRVEGTGHNDFWQGGARLVLPAVGQLVDEVAVRR
jgi:uncharacterized protein